jgi:hypothetical protein
MLHVFASNEQKFGDTFYMHVPSFAEHAEHRALLEWYDCNFVDKNVSRRRMPVIEHTGDSNVDAVKTTEWAGPVALFTTNGEPMTIPAVNLWRSETKTITPLSSGASAVVVPKSAVPYIKTQLYDYPYIDKTQQQRHDDTKLDIVFISNGELNAKSNFLQMTMYLANESRHTNRVHLVEGVNGRAAAYHAAAEASTTPWFFAVFAKLEVDIDFDKYEKIDTFKNMDGTTGRKLFELQKEGIKFLSTRKGAILASQMGSGKTVQATVAALETGAKKILIVCPSSVKINWKREINYYNEHDIAIINGKKWEDAKFTIINYDILESYCMRTMSQKIEINKVLLIYNNF